MNKELPPGTAKSQYVEELHPQHLAIAKEYLSRLQSLRVAFSGKSDTQKYD